GRGTRLIRRRASGPSTQHTPPPAYGATTLPIRQPACAPRKPRIILAQRARKVIPPRSILRCLDSTPYAAAGCRMSPVGFWGHFQERPETFGPFPFDENRGVPETSSCHHLCNPLALCCRLQRQM